MTPQPHHFVSSSDGSLYDTRDPNWSTLPPLRPDYMVTKCAIESVADLKATLRNGPYAWPGAYPLALYTSDGGTLCFDCVRKNFRNVADSIVTDCSDGWKVTGCDIEHAESGDVTCDHCGYVIAEGADS